jgi:uncharacterized protein (DUF1684 family)
MTLFVALEVEYPSESMFVAAERVDQVHTSDDRVDALPVTVTVDAVALVHREQDATLGSVSIVDRFHAVRRSPIDSAQDAVFSSLKDTDEVASWLISVRLPR